MKEEMIFNNKVSQRCENSSADLNPRSRTSYELEVSKNFTFRIRKIKPKNAVKYFHAAVSKLVDSVELDSLSDQEWFILFESSETLRRVNNQLFIDKHFKKTKFLWMLFVIEQTAPFRAKNFCEQEKLLDEYEKFVESSNRRNSTLGRITFADILIFDNRKIKRRILEPRFVGIGYKDKGCMTNLAVDGTPSWEEVSSDWRMSSEYSEKTSQWKNSSTGETFDWSIQSAVISASEI